MFDRIKQVDKILFARHLSIMLKSGMPFSEALEALKDQTDSKKLSEIIDYSLRAVKEGESLGQSLRNYKEHFSPLFLHMIEVGEQSGNLPSNLEYLAKQLKKSHDLKSKVKSAMLYPAIVLVATLLLGAGLAFFIFPKLISFFESLDVALPLPTRMVLWLAYNTRDYGIYFLVGLVGLIVGIRLLFRLRKVRFYVHKFWLKLPFVGSIIKKLNLAYFARTLSSLLEAGINIVEALDVAAGVMGNLAYRKELEEAKERIESGESLGMVLKEKDAHFPPVTAHMVEVGEETGSLSNTLLYLADFYEDDLDSATENLAEALEPILLIFMGIAVGFIAIAIIMPIYKITQGLQV